MDGQYANGLTSQQTGVVFKLNVPHMGNVVMETGRTTYLLTGTGPFNGLEVTSAAGHHPWKLQQPMPEAVCACSPHSF